MTPNHATGGSLTAFCDIVHKTVYFREFLSQHDVGRVCAAIIFEGSPGLPITAANTVMARHDGLSQTAEGGLAANIQTPEGMSTAANWLAQLKNMPLAQRKNFDEVIKVKRLRTHATYQLQCCALASDDLLRTKEGASFVVFVTDPAQVLLPTPDQLQRQLGLTPAEAQVALSLTQGMTYRAAAHQRNVTEETLRSQVKNIYAKTRVTQKNSLTRLVLSLGSAAV